MAMEQVQVRSVHSIEEWNEILKSAEENNNWLIVDFSASWCGPCRSIGPVFYELSKQNADSGLIFVKVDVDEMPEIAKQFSIRAMPTFAVHIPGTPCAEARRIVGANQTKLRDLIGEAKAELAAVTFGSLKYQGEPDADANPPTEVAP